MSNSTPSRFGSINGAGDVDALFLKVFSGEVLTSFEQTQVTMDKHYMRSITNGKSAQFPVTGRSTAEYHTPGTELLGNTIKSNEKVIVIDDILVGHSFIADIDEAKTHFDVRSIYSTEIGRALANQMDKHVLQTGVLAARTAKTINDADQFGGSVIYETGTADFETNGDDLADAMFAAAQLLDEKDVPAEDRFMFVRPAQFYALAKSTKVINRDWGGEGSYAAGNVIRVAGITIVKTNNLPSGVVANGTTAAGTGNRYAGDFTNTVGLVMHKSAVGTVKLRDLSVKSEYDLRRLGNLIVATYAVGHGVLRPESAVEIRAAAAPAP